MAKKIVLIILVVLVVAFLAYFAFFRGGEKSLPKTDMEGFLLLTLKPRTDNAVSGVYIYNLENRELKFFDDKNAVNITGHGLPGGDGITSSLLFDSLGEKNNEVFQLYRIAMQKNFEKRQITDSYTFFKRNPEWSPNGEKIVFMARKDIAGEPVSFSPDDWLVYMTGLAGQEKLLGKGAYPQWAPDNKKVLALRSDGLYLYDSEKQIGERVWNIEGGQGTLKMGIDVSRDGSMLAWSVPSRHQIVLMKIYSWEPFKMEVYKIIDNIFGFWPVFSPEVKYLALIAGQEKNGEGGVHGAENLHVVIYNLETFEPQDVLDLKVFSPSSMALTDWGTLDFKF